jgi:hypothetical protein
MLGTSETRDIAITVAPEISTSGQEAANALARALVDVRLTVIGPSESIPARFGYTAPIWVNIGKK